MDFHKLNITKRLLTLIIDVARGQPRALLIAILRYVNTLRPWLNTADLPGPVPMASRAGPARFLGRPREEVDITMKQDGS